MNNAYWSLFLSLLFAGLPLMGNTQSTEFRFAVTFKDKGGIASEYSSEAPLSYLSLRAVDRKFGQGIGIDSTDYPVHTAYRNQVLALNLQFKEAGLSRWLNCQVISCSDSSAAMAILALPFVESVQCIYQGPLLLKKRETLRFCPCQTFLRKCTTFPLPALTTRMGNLAFKIKCWPPIFCTVPDFGDREC